MDSLVSSPLLKSQFSAILGGRETLFGLGTRKPDRHFTELTEFTRTQLRLIPYPRHRFFSRDLARRVLIQFTRACSGSGILTMPLAASLSGFRLFFDGIGTYDQDMMYGLLNEDMISISSV